MALRSVLSNIPFSKTAVFIFCTCLFSGFYSLLNAQTIDSSCMVLYTQGQYDSALACFAQIPDTAPNYKEAVFNTGLCHYRLNQLQTALQDFNYCLHIDPAYDDARWMKGIVLERQNLLKEANTAFGGLDTKYHEYNHAQKRIRYNNFAVLISRNWYYMVAIMFFTIVLLTVVAKTITYKRSV
ncbi:MAG TPA: tetratricopeptide repeat protein [Chitinophagales bacterium]|nr:tetratricopeptide repeat protein [Chitinophagales bacterium]